MSLGGRGWAVLSGAIIPASLYACLFPWQRWCRPHRHLRHHRPRAGPDQRGGCHRHCWHHQLHPPPEDEDGPDSGEPRPSLHCMLRGLPLRTSLGPSRPVACPHPVALGLRALGSRPQLWALGSRPQHWALGSRP